MNTSAGSPAAGYHFFQRGTFARTAMATFLRNSEVWAVEYEYDGRTRHWLKALPQGADAEATMREVLRELYGEHARLVAVRRATAQEDEDFRRGDLPRNAYCPTGKVPLGKVKPPR